MDEKIKLFLHDSNNSVVEVLVNKYDQVSSLSSYIHGQDTKYVVHDTQVLLTAFTFAFYNIENDSHLYIYNHVKKKPITTHNKRFLRSHRSSIDITPKKTFNIFSDSNKLKRAQGFPFNLSDSQTNSELCFEVARLIDIHNAKCSFNTFDYKLSHLRTSFPTVDQSDFISNVQVSPSHERTQGPSTEALPCLW